MTTYVSDLELHPFNSAVLYGEIYTRYKYKLIDVCFYQRDSLPATIMINIAYKDDHGSIGHIFDLDVTDLDTIVVGGRVWLVLLESGIKNIINYIDRVNKENNLTNA